MSSVEDVVRNRRYLLLDFDGPVCSVFSGLSSRDAVAMLLREFDHPVPQHVSDSTDPFDVLHYAAELSPAAASAVERSLTAIECTAIRSARPTSSADAVMTRAVENGLHVAIVSNNSVAAVTEYLERQRLSQLVSYVSARTGGEVRQLKPSPYLLEMACKQLQAAPAECLFVGDSVTDITAGDAADIATIAYANRPEKVGRFAPLQPAAIITDMDHLSNALASHAA